jgi:hypothetical protein
VKAVVDCPRGRGTSHGLVPQAGSRKLGRRGNGQLMVSTSTRFFQGRITNLAGVSRRWAVRSRTGEDMQGNGAWSQKVVYDRDTSLRSDDGCRKYGEKDWIR